MKSQLRNILAAASGLVLLCAVCAQGQSMMSSGPYYPGGGGGTSVPGVFTNQVFANSVYFTNTLGVPLLVEASATLTEAAVSGSASMAEISTGPGAVTNLVGINTTAATTAGLAIVIPFSGIILATNGTLLFTNSSNGTGNSAVVHNGQYATLGGYGSSGSGGSGPYAQTNNPATFSVLASSNLITTTGSYTNLSNQPITGNGAGLWNDTAMASLSQNSMPGSNAVAQMIATLAPSGFTVTGFTNSLSQANADGSMSIGNSGGGPATFDVSGNFVGPSVTAALSGNGAGVTGIKSINIAYSGNLVTNGETLPASTNIFWLYGTNQFYTLPSGLAQGQMITFWSASLTGAPEFITNGGSAIHVPGVGTNNVIILGGANSPSNEVTLMVQPGGGW